MQTEEGGSEPWKLLLLTMAREDNKDAQILLEHYKKGLLHRSPNSGIHHDLECIHQHQDYP